METLRPDLAAFAFAAIGLMALVGVGEALRIWGGLSAESSRRVVHAGVGIFVAITPYLFARPDLVYVLAVIFVVVNYVTLRQGWFRGIHGTERRSLGTVTFPLALLPALFIGWSMDPGRVFALQLAFLILAFSDPLASVVGTRFGKYVPFATRAKRLTEGKRDSPPSGPIRRTGRTVKTWTGSAAFFISALLLSLAALMWFRSEGQIDWNGSEVVAAAIIVAAVTTAVEALGRRGWDNFFIILAALIVLVFFDEKPENRLVLLIAVAAGLVFGLITYRLRFLDGPGAIAGALLAASVIGLGGWAWAVPSFTFFVLSSLLSRVGRRRKAAVEAVSEKGSRRDAGQVFANGGAGWGLLLIYAVFPAEILYWGFLGAFAAATADTWGTEIGTLSSKPPRLITTWRPAPRGTSGAVSMVGTLGALAGAFVIGLSAWPFAAGPNTSPAMAALAVVGGGFVGSMVDSLIGATVQARFRDPRTGAETERSASDAGAHPLIRGRRWLRNDQVNWLCALSGAALAMACFQAVYFVS